MPNTLSERIGQSCFTYAFKKAGNPREGRNPSDEMSLHGGRELVISRSDPYGANAAGALEKAVLNGTTPSALLIAMFATVLSV